MIINPIQGRLFFNLFQAEGGGRVVFDPPPPLNSNHPTPKDNAHVFIGQFFKQNPNLGFLESLDVISRRQKHFVIRYPMITSRDKTYVNSPYRYRPPPASNRVKLSIYEFPKFSSSDPIQQKKTGSEL